MQVDPVAPAPRICGPHLAEDRVTRAEHERGQRPRRGIGGAVDLAHAGPTAPMLGSDSPTATSAAIAPGLTTMSAFEMRIQSALPLRGAQIRARTVAAIATGGEEGDLRVGRGPLGHIVARRVVDDGDARHRVGPHDRLQERRDRVTWEVGHDHHVRGGVRHGFEPTGADVSRPPAVLRGETPCARLRSVPAAQAIELAPLLLGGATRSWVAHGGRGDELCRRRHGGVIDVRPRGHLGAYPLGEQRRHLDGALAVAPRTTTRSPICTGVAGLALSPLTRTWPALHAAVAMRARLVQTHGPRPGIGARGGRGHDSRLGPPPTLKACIPSWKPSVGSAPPSSSCPSCSRGCCDSAG